ncbi:MAG: hypothetical protein SFU86_23640 [Pirellulaceae bacterium]|nr:hypothetical protein [Pirellulaceae bacterium]
MNRRHWFRSVLAILSLVAPGWLCAQEGNPSLYDTLRFGLKCRRQEEFDFVALVADKVEDGILPRDMVLSQFQWAREKRPHFPFYYFQIGLQQRAKQIGVEL